jgi:pimeloyl-ACP methyl ester carboxylesterase
LRIQIITIGAFIAAALAAPAWAQSPRLVSEEMMVKSADPGIEIYVRNKRPASMTAFRPERTVLFVHGATYPSEAVFDLRVEGASWMEFIASRGFDVYLLDVRGYGRSTRPPQMSDAPEGNPPLARGVDAVADVGAVVDWILARRKLSKINLLGWSWGCTLTATFASQNPAKVNRLALYAPGWIRTTPSLIQIQGKVGAYRSVRREQMLARWLIGVPEEKKATLIPPGRFDALADAVSASDPDGARQDPPVVRAPNGIVQDGLDFWSAGKPYYDPAKITAPVLLAVAEWDRDTPLTMTEALFPLLVNAPYKRMAVIAEGTHTVLLEKNRMELLNVVQQFLEE